MKSWVKNNLAASEFQLDDGLNYWREKIYKSIILIVSIVGLPAYAFGMYMSIVHKVYSVAIIDTVVYASLLYLWLKNPFKLRTKVHILICLPLIVGCSLILILGPKGAGFSYFIGL
nr:hypothetical protein [uncultured Carboxylicivirga sp.]